MPGCFHRMAIKDHTLPAKWCVYAALATSSAVHFWFTWSALLLSCAVGLPFSCCVGWCVSFAMVVHVVLISCVCALTRSSSCARAAPVLFTAFLFSLFIGFIHVFSLSEFRFFIIKWRKEEILNFKCKF